MEAKARQALESIESALASVGSRASVTSVSWWVATVELVHEARVHPAVAARVRDLIETTLRRKVWLRRIGFVERWEAAPNEVTESGPRSR